MNLNFKKKKPLTVVKPGTQRRDFTHVDDIVRGCYLAFKKGRNSEYMLGTKKTYSVIQIAKMFKRKIKFIPSRPGERLGSVNKSNKSFSHLGYKANIDIKDYIEKFIKNLHREIYRRKMRKQRIFNTIYLVGVFIFDFVIDNGEWI